MVWPRCATSQEGSAGQYLLTVAAMLREYGTDRYGQLKLRQILLALQNLMLRC